MAGIRALQKRMAKLEDVGKPRPSPFTVWFGSFDAWVEREVLPGVEGGALAESEMVELVACLRRWEHDGTWAQAYAG